MHWGCRLGRNTYDTAPRAAKLETLRNEGVSEDYVSLIKFMYRYARIRVNRIENSDGVKMLFTMLFSRPANRNNERLRN